MIVTAAMMIRAPSKPAEKNAMRSYPYGNLLLAGRPLSHRLKAANATAMTWIIDSAASDMIAAEPVIA